MDARPDSARKPAAGTWWAPARAPRAWLLLALAAMLLAGWLVYLPGLRGGFVFDDFSNIVQQPSFAAKALHEHFWAAVWAGRAGPLSRALSMLSFAWQVRVWGMQPGPMKVFNVLLHLGNALLVAALSWRVLQWEWQRQRAQRGAAPTWVLPAPWLALLLAAAWTLAPIQLTAVLYVVQREESLAAGLVLLGLLGYWHGRMRLRRAVQAGSSRAAAWAWIWGSLLGGTALAALAKETGVLLPAYAAVIEWVLLRGDCGAEAGSRAQRDLRCALGGLYLVVLVLPGVLGLAWLLPSILHGGYADRPFTLDQRLLTEGRVMVDYLHWTLLPDLGRLSLYHDDIGVSTSWLQPWTTAASWALLATLLLAGVALRQRAPLISLGLLWFFVGQSPVSTFVPLDLAYEHRNYLPSWGLLLAVFALVAAWSPRRRGSWPLVAGTLCTGLVALYGGLTALRAQAWASPYRLAYFEAAAHPRSPRAIYGYARVLYQLAATPDSPLFHRATRQMQACARLPDAGLEPLQALVFMHARWSLPVRTPWWEALRAGVRDPHLGPQDIASLYSLVQCAADKVCHFSPADLRQLRGLLDDGVAAHPFDAELRTLRANFEVNVSHRYPAAYRDMLRAVALAPGNFDFWKNLVQLQIAGGQFAQASFGLRRLRELDTAGLHHAQLVALRRAWERARQAAAARPGAGAGA